MLIDEYLPVYQFDLSLSLEIDAPVEKVYEVVRRFDLSNARLLRFLFWVRSVPAILKGQKLLGYTLSDLESGFGAYVLDEDPPREFCLAFPGKVWTLSPSVNRIEKSEFRDYVEPHLAKSIWGFSCEALPGGRTLLKTETRCHCVDEFSEKMVRRYARIFRPLIKLTRKSALRAFKKQAER